MSLRFSPAAAEDVQVLLSLNRQLIQQYEDLTSIDFPRVLDWVDRNIQAHLPCFRRVHWGEALVGYYCLIPGDGGTELDSFFVLPQYRCQGIGTQILLHIFSTARPPIFLYVFRRNIRAIALYQRMGFRITKEVGKTRFIMQKQDC